MHGCRTWAFHEKHCPSRITFIVPVRQNDSICTIKALQSDESDNCFNILQFKNNLSWPRSRPTATAWLLTISTKLTASSANSLRAKESTMDSMWQNSSLPTYTNTEKSDNSVVSNRLSTIYKMVWLSAKSVLNIRCNPLQYVYGLRSESLLQFQILAGVVLHTKFTCQACNHDLLILFSHLISQSSLCLLKKLSSYYKWVTRSLELVFLECYSSLP